MPIKQPETPPPSYTSKSPDQQRTTTATGIDFDPSTLKADFRSRRQKTQEALERERLVLPFLPPVEQKPTPIRTFIFTQFYKLVLVIIHTLFSIYLRTRWAYHNVVNRGFSILYYHHRTPQLIQKDIHQLKECGKLPKHVSVILDYEAGGLETLIDEVAEISCWCASAGIPMLSVYERSGILKSYIATSHRSISQRLRRYFGRLRPSLRVHAPHSPSFPSSDGLSADKASNVDLEVMLISEEDGRESLVDLTKTLCDMAQRGKIASEDVSVELIDAEMKESVMEEPDLLILFSPNVTLKGYPPWPIRLTEIYNVQDNDGVGYQVFLRGLYKYASAEMKVGK